MKPFTGILGGGIAGLSLAALLGQAGHAVTVYEAGAPGGKLSRLDVGGLEFSTGPSLFTFPGVWRRFLSVLNETDALNLQPLPGGLGTHHTPFGAVPLPVAEGHPLHGDWQRYVRAVGPLTTHLETLLTTPPRLGSAAFIRASAAVGKVLGPHLSAEGWIRAQRFPPPLAHALRAQALNAGLSPQDAPALYALLPALIAAQVFRPAGGMGALLAELLRLCAARGVTVRAGTPVLSLDARRATIQLEGEAMQHDLIVSALDPARLAVLRGLPTRSGPRTVSGLALYAAFEHELNLPATTVLTPGSYRDFRAALHARALPPDTLALIHADGRRLALLLSVPATGQPMDPEQPWVRAQIHRVERALGVPGLLQQATAVRTLDPAHYAWLGTPGGAIYGRANPLWRAGPVHPQPYRIGARLWQVGTAVHPGGGIPAILGGALIVARLLDGGLLGRGLLGEQA
ncbi:NAD(P)/FAD-dependent oxidoreductase [Deinococcus sp.]|uniref:phytoene desaturase family protein n=1 Tax=Deinococcus sp. TaxID=47478 RepID=UPI0025DCAABC|nr:NAD(P)/FAD-dependent oxidoreductase [Deinococcus sp.]